MVWERGAREKLLERRIRKKIKQINTSEENIDLHFIRNAQTTNLKSDKRNETRNQRTKNRETEHNRVPPSS